MNITIFSNTKGGVFTHTILLVTKLANKGHHVNVYFLNKSERLKELVNTEHISYNYIFTAGVLPNVLAITKFLFREKTDILHINFAIFGPLAILKKRINNIPFIYSLHGIPEPWNIIPIIKKIKYIIEYSLFSYTASKASATISISNYIKNKLKQMYHINSEVIYNCIDIQKFKLINKDMNRQQLGYNNNDFIILFVGKLSMVKDPITLVKAVCKVLESRSNIYLILVGEGEQTDDILYLINKLGISNNVKLTGYLTGEMLLRHYHAADLFVLPSYDEAFGIVLLEAMASGLPIICSNAGACPEVIGNAGIIFKQGDYLDLAKKILELYGNSELLKSLSIEGLKRVQIFSCESAINNYLMIYEKMGISQK